MKEGKELFLKHLKECGVNLERIKWYKQAQGYKLYSRFKDVELAAKIARSFNGWDYGYYVYLRYNEDMYGCGYYFVLCKGQMR